MDSKDTADAAESSDGLEPRSDFDRNSRREQRSAAVRGYVEGGSRHPGFLLPWEDFREDEHGFYYFVDLVTDEITWKEAKKPGERKSRLYDRSEVMHVPPWLYFAPAEEKAAYFRRRALYVDYWRYYLALRSATLS